MPAPAEAVVERIYTLPFYDSFSISRGFIPGSHYGIDYVVGTGGVGGERIVAASAGVAENCPLSASAGWYMVMDHGNGHRTRYLHLNSQALPADGQSVPRGQVIGYEGNTGYTNPPGFYHLHFETRHGATQPADCSLNTAKIGAAVDPYAGSTYMWTTNPPRYAEGYSYFQQWLLRTGTILHPTDSTWEFAVADWTRGGVPDLIGIRKQSGSGRTEAHILYGESNYQGWALQTTTPFGTTDSTFTFEAGDYNHDGYTDLYVIRTQSGSGRTEVHILSGASNFQQWLLQTTTPLHPTDTVNWGFAVADWDRGGTPDLWIIRKQSGSGRTEVHILSGESNYQQWVQQIITPLGTTDSTFTFDAGDYNSDTVPDLFIIRTQSGSGWTEVHVLSGASSFQQWVLQTTTPLHPTDTVNWAFAVADWSGGGVPDLFIIKKRFATSTEVHILGG